MPEIDVHRRTTKVNLSVMAAVVLFLLIGTGIMIWLANRQ